MTENDTARTPYKRLTSHSRVAAAVGGSLLFLGLTVNSVATAPLGQALQARAAAADAYKTAAGNIGNKDDFIAYAEAKTAEAEANEFNARNLDAVGDTLAITAMGGLIVSATLYLAANLARESEQAAAAARQPVETNGGA